VTARRALWTASWRLLASLLLHELLARVLDDARLAEPLLAPSPGRADAFGQRPRICSSIAVLVPR
jgi:hypothetical protein